MNEVFAVESGIPMPSPGNGHPGKGRRKYPFAKLKIGESFLVPCGEDWDIKQAMNSLTSCIRYATYQTGFKFAMRTIPGGIRVWRIQ